MSKLSVQRCDFRSAQDFVRARHRHSAVPTRHKFSLALLDGNGLMRGVAIVGLPKARALGNGKPRADGTIWLEIVRVCTDGIRNGCSKLYGAACREIARAGANRAVTYTRSDESGSSLRASGFRADGTVRARSWGCKSRPRRDKDERVDRIRWTRALGGRE